MKDIRSGSLPACTAASCSSCAAAGPSLRTSLLAFAAHRDLELAVLHDRVAKEVEEREHEVGRTEAELRRTRAQIKELESSLAELRALVNRYSSCRHCGAGFSCSYDSTENCIRCSECRTRHF